MLGDPVRYDGGHKRSEYLVEVLGRDIEWVPVCPEVEAGLGTPREPMQLVGSSRQPKLITGATKQDKTTVLKRFSARRVRELKALSLSGYVFKARSPSCGIDDVLLYDRHSQVKQNTAGLFARAFLRAFPLIPVTDETRLADPVARQRFLAQVRRYSRRKILAKKSAMRLTTSHRRKSTRITRRSRTR